MPMNLFQASTRVFSSPLINQNHSCLGFLPVSVTCYHSRRKTWKQIEIKITVPARDRVIDFGKYKGKMLGTLPSSYLKWISKNLRARDFEEWAKLADQVLRDPIYRDRIEWEFAQKLLNGNQLNYKSLSSSRTTAVSELMEISERFGWDNQDKLGWSKVNFELLGTSKGGRIPRLETSTATETQPKHKECGFEVEVLSVSDQGGTEARTRRMERRERQKTMRLRREAEAQPQTQTVWWSGMKEKSSVNEFEFDGDRDVADHKKKKNTNMDDDGGKDGEMGQNGIGNPFPGREALLRKAINHGL